MMTSTPPASASPSPAVDLLAAAAVQPVRSGMVVGLGTGRAASRGIHALAGRVSAERLDVSCVATSTRSADLARSLGLTVLPMAQVRHVDVLFDGADEVDPHLCMIKGAGGAMTWEKIVAEAADLRIYLIDDSKLVQHLGQRYALPIEVIEFARASVEARLVEMGLEPTVRPAAAGSAEAYRTDEGNLVIDARIPEDLRATPAELDAALNAVPGILDHGLFVNQADVVIVESADRSRIEKRMR